MASTVYVIAKGDYVKVGVTSDLRRRFREYDGRLVGCRAPVDLDPAAPARVLFHASGDTDTEGFIMAAFHAEHVVGEWFRNTGTTAALLERLGHGNLLFPGRTARRFSTWTSTPIAFDVAL